MISVKITGFKEAEKNIIKKIKKANEKAAKSYQKDLEDAVKKRVPVASGATKKSIQSKVEVKRDEVIIEVFSTDPKSNIIEFGTKFMKGFFFMRDTAIEQEKIAAKIWERRLKIK